MLKHFSPSMRRLVDMSDMVSCILMVDMSDMVSCILNSFQLENITNKLLYPYIILLKLKES